MSAKRGVKMHLLRILRDTGGNVMPMAAVGMLVMAALVGGGVDMSHAYRVQSRLQAACDAGVLAARKTVNVEQNGYSSRVERTARDYFEANFDKNQQAVRDEPVFTPSSPDGGDTIKGTASATVDTAIMRIFGFNTMPVSVDCTASMGVGNSDITMVLDVTGSMAWAADGDKNPARSGKTTRLYDLQAAMKNFYTTVKTSADRSGARIRYAFVPYSSSVNVGHLLMDLDPDYIVDRYRIQSRQWVDWNDPVVTAQPQTTTCCGSEQRDNQASQYSGPYTSSSTCNSKIPATPAWANNGSATTTTTVTLSSSGDKIEQISSTQQQRRYKYYCSKSGNSYYVYRKYEYQNVVTSFQQTSTAKEWLTDATHASSADNLIFRQVEYDVSRYKTFADNVRTFTGGTYNNYTDTWSSPAWVTSAVWAGCIEERETVAEADFSYANNVISPTEAIDLNIDLEPDSDASTQWAPMWPEVAYLRENASGDLISDAFSFEGSQAGSYCPVKSQLLTEMTQKQFNDYANSLSPNGATYHDIGILWGARLSSPNGIFAANVNARPSNGGEVSRHMIFMTDGEMAPNNDIQTSYGIEWHDRRVTDDGSSENDDRHTSRFLALCEAVKGRGIRLWVIAFGTGLTTDLQTCASPSSSFAASSSTQLNAAFQTIGTQVGELRITQ